MEVERSQPSQVKKKSLEVDASSSSRPCAMKKLNSFKRYPDYSNIADDDLVSHLQDCGLDQLYSCLNWRWTPLDFIVDFVGHARIQESPRFEDSILQYFPHGSDTPIVFTMGKVAETFNLNLHGFCRDKAQLKEVDMGDRFQVQRTPMGECYFSVTSAATSALHILARFVIQVIFLSQTMKGTMISMRHLQVALGGERVAWGKLLWKYLLKRLQSCQQQEGARDFYSKLKSSHCGMAAVIGALLVRVEIENVPEHEAWYNSLLDTFPDFEDSETDNVEIMQADEKKRRCSCGRSGCHSSEPFDPEDGIAQEEEQGPQVKVEVMIDDVEAEHPHSAFRDPPVQPEANEVSSVLVVYHPTKDDDRRGAADDHEVDKKRKRARMGASLEGYNENTSLQGDGGVPLIKWEENSDKVDEPSTTPRTCPETREKLLVKDRLELPFQGASELKECKIEDLSGQELLQQFTKMVNDWSEETSIEEEDVNLKKTNSMNVTRDIFESVSNANRTLENALKVMEEKVQLKSKSVREKYDALQEEKVKLKSESVREKYDALQDRVKERSDLTIVEEQKENLVEETKEIDRDIANQPCYDNVNLVTADLRHDIMNFKREIKVMNLYLHVNNIKLEQREVEVSSMMNSILILLETLNSLEEKRLHDSLYEEIRQLLNVKTFMLKRLVEDIRNLNEGLKLLQEKLENEVELLELKEEEIKSSRGNL